MNDGAGEPPENPRHEDGCDASLLTQTIRSEKWWFFSEMLLRLHNFSHDFATWAEGCPCHFWLRPERHEPQSGGRVRSEHSEACQNLRVIRRMKGLRPGEGDGPEFTSCPLGGRRAPELASNAAERFMEELSKSYVEDLMQCCSCTDPAEMEQVLADFSLGKASMMSYITQKLHCWRVLPWRLAALALPDVAEARKHARDILEEFEQPGPFNSQKQLMECL